MAIQKKSTLAFYQNLGKLFYAIAASDGVVRDLEFAKLKVIVKEQWIEVDAVLDVFGADAAYQIEIVFDWLNEEDVISAETCFNDFVNYKKEETHLFTDNVKSLILKTASAVAYAFSGINKAELIMLAQLEIALKK